MDAQPSDAMGDGQSFDPALAALAVARLAALPRLQYDKCRVAEAKKLADRVRTRPGGDSGGA